ncbi:hypothetical protein AB0B25_30210 [Nocardia sp. NPDC049190]|uniref:hypothetical protein n=1 Tax=Nocardia sp. NPDC049190 TaxID=3155650 RepID=UPI0033D3DAF9
MQTAGPGKPEPLSTNLTSIFLGRTAGGSRSVYKPAYLENLTEVVRRPEGYYVWHPLRYGIGRGGGELAKREVAAFRVDEALGFGRVPPTAMVNGIYGPGSHQLWVFSTPSHPGVARIVQEQQLGRILSKTERRELLRLNAQYPKVQREQMAVLDYVIGNTDRHMHNYRTGHDGEIVAIDHSLSFPEFPDSRVGIRSDFTLEFHNVGLSEDVLRSVRAVDVDRLRTALDDLGLSRKAIDGALDRLIEVRTHGRITGEAWPGEINEGYAWRNPVQGG